MSNYTGIAQIDRQFDDAEETRNKRGNRIRQIFFSADRYLGTVVARFHATEGKDVYYLSHPETHKCMARLPGDGGCDFLE